MAISSYLAGLRRRIGRDLVLMPSVSVMPFDREGRILLVRSAETDFWQTVGGAIDPGESPADAAVREAREETGFEVALVRVIGVYGGPVLRLTYPNGDVCEYISVAFEARVTGGAPRADGDETSAVAWFTAEQARRLPVERHTTLLLQEAFAPAASARFPSAWT